MTTIRIEAHDDDSVTVECGSITARISSVDGYADANRAAHALGGLIASQYAVVRMQSRLDGLRRRLQDVSVALDDAHEVITGVIQYARDRT